MTKSADHPTNFTELNTVLAVFVDELKAVLEDDLVAVYLTGSFALGAGDVHSDVDYMAVVEKPLAEGQVADLQAMHPRMYGYPSEWAKHLEGSYFPRAIAKQKDNPPTLLWYLDNGATELVQSLHDNQHVVRWVTRKQGITLYGDDPEATIDPVPIEAMKSEVAQIMHDWGTEIITGGYQITSRWAQPFAVLMYCRMLYTLEHGRIESKRVSAKWAMTHLDSQWHDLIQSAWEERPNPSEKAFLPAPQADIDQTIEFIQYAFQRSKHML